MADPLLDHPDARVEEVVDNDVVQAVGSSFEMAGEYRVGLQ